MSDEFFGIGKRDIKFRAWDKRIKEFVSAFVVENSGDAHCFNRIPGVKDKESNISYWKEGVIVMQYTGFEDKNGKAIYEGDIVTYIYNNSSEKPKVKKTGVVRYRSDIEGAYFCMGEDEHMHEDWTIKIIGNIFENPELIK